MQFSVKPKAAAVPAEPTFDLMAIEAAQAELMDNYHQLRNLTDEAKELDAVVFKVNMSVDMLKTFGAQAIPYLNADHGLEEFFGVKAELLTVEKSLEGFGDSIKSFVDRIIEIIKKIIENVRNFIGKVFKTTGYCAREILNKDNDIDMDVVIPNIHSKETFFKLITMYVAVAPAFYTSIEAVAKGLKATVSAKASEEADKAWELPRKYLKELAAKSDGILVYDDDTGRITTNMSAGKQDQTLANAGYSKGDIGDLAQSCSQWFKLPTVVYNACNKMSEVSSAVAEFKNAVLRNIIPGEAAQNGFRMANIMISSCIACYQALMRAQIEMDGFISKIYRKALIKKGAEPAPAA